MFGESALDVAEGADRSGELQFRAGLFFYPAIEPPAMKVSIRGGGNDTVTLFLDGQELGSMERPRAMTSAHEGAVYLHRGASFLVASLDLDEGRAEVMPFDAHYYTQAIVQSVIDPRVEFRSVELNDAQGSLTGITVTDMVVGFRKKSLDGDTVLGVEPLDLPPMTYDTVALRLDLPALPEEEMALGVAGVHALEHALMAVAPLLAGCDRADLGSAWYSVFPDTMRPAVFVFDKTPGGVGLSERLFDSLAPWLRAAHDLLQSCPCDAGCPACLLSARCEANNEVLEKGRGIELLRDLIRKKTSCDEA